MLQKSQKKISDSNWVARRSDLVAIFSDNDRLGCSGDDGAWYEVDKTLKKCYTRDIIHKTFNTVNLYCFSRGNHLEMGKVI